MKNQIDIFSQIYPKFVFTKPIRLIEFFAGYGSQALALKYLDMPFEHWKTCEWAVKSIQAYKDIHYTNVDTDYSKDLSKEEIIDYLSKLGISSNYNEPMTFEQIKRVNETQLRKIYNNIKITKNLVNIQNVKGRDLEIVDTDKYDYILTYSFPCQDLSLAGKRAGMSDNSTRSGMLWEVERILEECHEIGQMPRVLLMENVPQVIGKDNVEYFNKWQSKLEQLDYKNYHQNLIATDYGIPQTRNRTFMISVLGDYSYTFPQTKPLKLKLKDMLEKNVNEKYYLSDKMTKYIFSEDDKYKVNKNSLQLNREIAVTKTTREGNTRADSSDYITIPEATKKGYVEAYDGDGVYINRPHQKRGCVQKNKIQTLKTSLDVGVVENLRIRKLTPKECFRLMGVKDEDYHNVAKNQSDSSLYHLAGDSIVVNVLMAIFKEMIGSD